MAMVIAVNRPSWKKSETSGAHSTVTALRPNPARTFTQNSPMTSSSDSALRCTVAMDRPRSWKSITNVTSGVAIATSPKSEGLSIWASTAWQRGA